MQPVHINSRNWYLGRRFHFEEGAGVLEAQKRRDDVEDIKYTEFRN